LYRDASKLFLAAYTAYLKQRDKAEAARCACHLGDVHRQLEKFNQARRWYALVSKLNPVDKTLVLDARLGDAMALRGLERFDEAIVSLQKCRKAYDATGDTEAFAFILWAIGTTERFRGNIAAAEQHLTESINFYKSSDNPSGLAYAWAGLGGTLRMKGWPEDSGALYAHANQTFEKLGDQFGQAYTCCGQGNALRMQGNLEGALPFMNRAISLYKKLGMKGPLGFVLWSRGQLEILQGQFAAARADINACARLFHAVRDERGQVYAALGLGELARAQGQANASNFYRAALKKARRLKLALEILHARRGLEPKKLFRREYAKLGVDTPSFLQYRSLP
jgi:tetratricopeptide (TPR) repeat protein